MASASASASSSATATASLTTSAASAALESLLLQSRHTLDRPSSSHMENLACCCGRQECAYLKHNHSALDGLEKSVQTAAQLGQVSRHLQISSVPTPALACASTWDWLLYSPKYRVMPLTWALQALLVRHEAYMADAESERRSMNGIIERLEADKRDMEAQNAKTVEENRNLLDQLEDLNNSVADSDAHVKSLTMTLQSTQQELLRVSNLASRTAELEKQLVALEQERADLQQSLTTTEEEEKSAIQRWRKAERTLGDLRDQIERIETEAKEERERHDEVVGRLERGRLAEKQMENAAGKVNGAAAAVTAGRTGNGSNVVSHFVKDILQENANLQMGIVELREMLNTSNEDVQMLREQLLLHQPIASENQDGTHVASLQEELAPEMPRTVSQELHIHHHYHAAERAKEKAQVRRTKKRRNITTPGLFTPPATHQSPRTPRAYPVQPPPALMTSTTLTSGSVNGAITCNPASSNRWSMQSAQTQSSGPLSSVPSSPQSIYQRSSIFDRAPSDQAVDSSRPTSPESNEASSPLFRPYHRSRDSDASFRSFTAPAPFQLKAAAPTSTVTALYPTAEEDDDGTDTENVTDLDISSSSHTAIIRAQGGHHRPEDATFPSYQDIQDDDIYKVSRYSDGLRRSASNESLISVSGMDIHTLCERPSQLCLGGRGFSGRAPPSLSNLRAAYGSSQPVLSATTATARPSLASHRFDSRAYTRDLLQSSASPLTPTAEGEPLAKRVGGWVWSRLGSVPSSESGNRRETDPMQTVFPRGPGVNQTGPIKGLRPPPRAPSHVQASNLDENLLAETLQE